MVTEVVGCPDNFTCVHGLCASYGGDIKCACVRGYGGASCDVNIDDCESSPCLNNGTCADGINEYKCNCSPGFYGELF